MEFTVYAGESYIGYLIKPFQGLHHPVADFTAGDFPVKIPLQTLAYIVDHPVDFIRGDGAFIAGVFNAFAQFVGIKIFPLAVAFNYLEFALDNAFVGTETVGTGETLPAAAHPETFFDHP